MRVVLHDYAGHPLGVSLSRSLANRGHDILHLYSGSFETPHGAMSPQAGDSPRLQIEPITLPQQTQRQNLLKRRMADQAYAKLAVKRIEEFHPEVVVTANSLLEVVAPIQDWAISCGVKHVFWAQDLVGVAGAKLIQKKLPIVGNLLGAAYANWEQKLLSRSHHVVAISEDFKEYIPVPDKRITIIENWAPLDEVPVGEKSNDWSKSKGLDKTKNVIYTGTLGMKHNPELLIRLAKSLQDQPDVKLVVISAGDAIDYLDKRKAEESITNMHLLPFQLFADLPNVLASASVLIGLLEPEAGVFSVPSKVLSYLCASRPIVLAVPLENLIARIVSGSGAGTVVSSSEEQDFIEGVYRYLSDETLAAAAGKNGRTYAEKTFDLELITNRFEQVLGQL